MKPLLSLKFLIKFFCLYQKESHLCLGPPGLVIRNNYYEQYHIKAFALENANAISKDFLAFYASKPFASENCIPNYCKKFCNSATVQF